MGEDDEGSSPDENNDVPEAELDQLEELASGSNASKGVPADDCESNAESASSASSSSSSTSSPCTW